MEDQSEVNESGDNQENNGVSRIFSLFALTMKELKLLNIKTDESNNVIQQMLRYLSLFDEVAKLKISINYNLKMLTNQMKYFIDVHNKLHGFAQEIDSIIEDLNNKPVQTNVSKIPRRIIKNEIKKDTIKIVDSKSNLKNEERKRALETVRSICKEFGNFNEETDNEKEFLNMIFEKQKIKIKNILPVLQLHMKFYTDLSEKLDDFQNFINDATEEVKANSSFDLPQKMIIPEQKKSIPDITESDSATKVKSLERQKTQVLEKKIENQNRPITSTVTDIRRQDDPQEESRQRPSTQACRRNWIKIFPSTHEQNSIVLKSSVKKEKLKNKDKCQDSSDGDHKCNKCVTFDVKSCDTKKKKSIEKVVKCKNVPIIETKNIRHPPKIYKRAPISV